MSQLQCRNGNQTFISNFVFQFIKKNEMALQVDGSTAMPLTLNKKMEQGKNIPLLTYLTTIQL